MSMSDLLLKIGTVVGVVIGNAAIIACFEEAIIDQKERLNQRYWRRVIHIMPKMIGLVLGIFITGWGIMGVAHLLDAILPHAKGG